MRNYNKRNDRKTEMFDAVCDECGKDCKVPFKPTSGKPIYCSDCFEKHDTKKFDRKPKRDYSHRGQDTTKVLEEINSKLDYIIETLKYNGKY